MRCRKIVRKDFGLRSSRLFIPQIQLLYSSAVGLVGAMGLEAERTLLATPPLCSDAF